MLSNIHATLAYRQAIADIIEQYHNEVASTWQSLGKPITSIDMFEAGQRAWKKMKVHIALADWRLNQARKEIFSNVR